MNALQTCFLELGTRRHYEAQQLLLRAGEVAQRLYLIEQGAARLYVIDSQGRETTTQFFFEGDVVSSLESLMSGNPSAMHLITMEACHVHVLEGSIIKARIKNESTLQADLLALTQQRLFHYVKLYTSAIADSPTQRYLNLQATHSHQLERIPQHILASYLGVSAVHLSRIRRKLKNIPPDSTA
ncbi:Crp/Fnr family transcriptional regulator [Undibacterium sp. TS12]|uniref:Crp/Fnr family transcriptional regulator n=1 Tax=Undibacterium sp. TS12 TaxID=2908202 RepID=UPI001F4CBC99|nr:Crp/Fnr family transcriptional regulator [Undibacterium sp. TS12]MCH8622337.1 Crp/Fnr family transcriptional regulator [Undibacterium sp. TS12]